MEIGYLIGAFVPLLGLFFYCYLYVEKLEDRAEEIVTKKIAVIQDALLKGILSISGKITAGLFKKYKKEISAADFQGIVDMLSSLTPEEVEKGMKIVEISSEDRSILKIEEADADSLYSLLSIGNRLREIPEKLSKIADEMISAIICNVMLLILIGAMASKDFIPLGLLSLVEAGILITFTGVAFWGVRNILTMRNWKKWIKNLERVKTTDDINKLFGGQRVE